MTDCLVLPTRKECPLSWLPAPMSRWSCNHRWPTSFEASTAELPTFIFMSVFHFFRQKEETLYHNRLDDSRGQGMPHCVFHLFFIPAYYLVCYTLLTVQIYGDMNMPFSIYYNMDESWSNVTMENPWGRLITSWTVITTTTRYHHYSSSLVHTANTRRRVNIWQPRMCFNLRGDFFFGGCI